MGGRGASSGAGTSREAIYSDGRKGVREFTDKFKSAMKRAGFTDSYVFDISQHDTVQDAIKDVMKDAKDEIEYEKNRGGSGKGYQSLYDRLDKESKAIESNEKERISVAKQLAKALGYGESNYRELLRPSYIDGYSFSKGKPYTVSELKRQLKRAKGNK